MNEKLRFFRRDDSGLSAAFFFTDSMQEVVDSHLDAIEALTRSSGKVTRICAFEDPTSSLQAMLIAQNRGMDSRPRVLVKPKLFMPLRGRLVLLKVDTNGDVLTRDLLYPGRNVINYVKPRQPYIDLPIDEVTCHLEITLGPHDRVGDRNFPPVAWDESETSRARWREVQIRLTLDNETISPNCPGAGLPSQNVNEL